MVHNQPAGLLIPHHKIVKSELNKTVISHKAARPRNQKIVTIVGIYLISTTQLIETYNSRKKTGMNRMKYKLLSYIPRRTHTTLTEFSIHPPELFATMFG